MVYTDEDSLPGVLRQWLDDNSIPLDPDERGQGIWAEWDAGRAELQLGWWGETNCLSCGQPDRPERSLIVPAGFGDNNWQHGCGIWWAPFQGGVHVPDVLDETGIGRLLESADDELIWLRARQRDAVTKLKLDLAGSLTAFLRENPTDEERDEAAQGSDIEPGVWRNSSGRWEIWAYDPRDPTETIAVTEDELGQD